MRSNDLQYVCLNLRVSVSGCACFQNHLIHCIEVHSSWKSLFACLQMRSDNPGETLPNGVQQQNIAANGVQASIKPEAAPSPGMTLNGPCKVTNIISGVQAFPCMRGSILLTFSQEGPDMPKSDGSRRGQYILLWWAPYLQQLIF